MAPLHGVSKMENSAGPPRGVVFGVALDKVLAVRNLKQVDIAAALGTTQSTVSAWKRGHCLPDMETVFALERLLGLRPGQLSRHLGYLPLETETAKATVEDAIAQCTELDEAGAKATLMVYRTMVAMRANMLKLAGEATKPAGASRAAKVAKAAQANTVAAAKAADTTNITTLAKTKRKAATTTPPAGQSRRPSSSGR